MRVKGFAPMGNARGSQQLRNPQHELFAKEFVASGDARAAAHAASIKGGIPAAARLLQDDRVARRVRWLNQQLTTRIEMKAERVVAEVAAIALADPKDAYDANGELLPINEWPEALRRAVAGFEVEERSIQGVPTGRVRTTKVKFWNKTQALELAMRYLRLFEQIKPPGEGEEQPAPEADQLVQVFGEALSLAARRRAAATAIDLKPEGEEAA
jgi:phage terminase small subunit